MSSQCSEDDLVRDLQRITEKIGKPPTWAEYKQYGRYSLAAIYDVFGGMEGAREKM